MLSRLGEQHQQVAQSLQEEVQEHQGRLEQLKRETADRRDSNRRRMKEMIDLYQREVRRGDDQAQEVRRREGEG